MVFNTSAARHSKTKHDQIGGTIHSHLDRCSKSNGPDQFRITHPNRPLSLNIADHLIKTFRVSKDGTLTRCFVVVRVEDTCVGDSPCERLLDDNGMGITKFHSCMIEEKRIRFRKVSYACAQCINCDHARQCGQQLYAGKWTNWIDIPDHVPYDDLVDANEKRRRNAQLNFWSRLLNCI